MRVPGLDGVRIPTIHIMHDPMDVFTNISRYSKDQRLNSGHLTMLDLPELMTGSDHDFGPHINRTIWKKDYFYSHFQL